MDDGKKSEVFSGCGIFWLVIIIILFVGLPIGLYIGHLGHLTWSTTDPTPWGQLGDFLNPIISIGNIIVVIILAIIVNKSQRQRDIAEEKAAKERHLAQLERDEWEKKYLALQEKPSLIFVAYGGAYYQLYNMGKGTAHKVIIGKIPSSPP